MLRGRPGRWWGTYGAREVTGRVRPRPRGPVANGVDTRGMDTPAGVAVLDGGTVGCPARGGRG